MWRVVCGFTALDKFLEAWEHFFNISKSNTSEKNTHEFLKGMVNFCTGAAAMCCISGLGKDWNNMFSGKPYEQQN